MYSNNFVGNGKYWWSDSVVENGADKIYVEQMVSSPVQLKGALGDLADPSTKTTSRPCRLGVSCS